MFSTCCKTALQFFFILLFFLSGISAQTQFSPLLKEKDIIPPILVADILITGNKKTKPQIILRELSFGKGHLVLSENIDELLVRAKQQLINTSLFLSVTITKQYITDTSIVISISVKERWYIFPAPVFSLADKNLNLWWNQQRRSLNRVSYGLALDYKNVTGHNDNFSVGFQTGYNPSWGIFYNRPNMGKKQQHEIGLLFVNGKAKEVNYTSMLDKKSFFNLNNFIRHHIEGKLLYTYRKNIYTRHIFSLAVAHESVSDTVAKLNPSYLGKGRTDITYPTFTYRFLYNNTNNLLYPLKGKSFSAELLHNGLGKKDCINTTQLKIDGALFIPLGKHTYFNTSVIGKIFLPRHQPFIFLRGLGYDDREVFRGLDKYVLDGNAYGIIKANLIRRLFTTTVNAKFLPQAFGKIPFQFYIKGLIDAGYVASHLPGNNMLVNRLLFTKGIALDVVSFYDINLTFEYSFNQWMESGLFFRLKFGLQNQ